MAALGDMFAVASVGTYPTATPSDEERAIFAVSYGLLDTAPGYVPPAVSGFNTVRQQQGQGQT